MLELTPLNSESLAKLSRVCNRMSQTTEISATIPDWSRERVRRFFDPSRQLLRHIRGYQRVQSQPLLLRRIRTGWHVFWYRVWSVVTGTEIDLNAKIAGGLLMPHPNGIVIHPDVLIGPNCLIFQQVTLGTGGPKLGSPTLGGHVDIGAGARILGGVTIGDHARIGANAVVLQDVPGGATAVGVPARIIEPVDRAPIDSSHADSSPIDSSQPTSERGVRCESPI